MFLYRRTLTACGLLAVFLAGCGKPEAQFEPNLIYLRSQEHQTGDIPADMERDITTAVTALFGTPDAPYVVPSVEGIDQVLDIRRIRIAAGPVRGDQQGRGAGLYRQHCVHCHGITGNGKGPTAAFLNPYPRDFRRGTFKFTSTPVGVKPTEDDLRHVLREGIAGTAMPSFKLLSSGEIEALIDYVKYLAIRGEVERRLIQEAGDFFDTEDAEENAKLREDFFSADYLVDEVLAETVDSWNTAREQVTEIPERPDVYDPDSSAHDPAALQASIDRGRKLYYTSAANCFSCHGPAQLGDGQTNDYDVWTKEFYDWTKKSENPEEYQSRLNEYLTLGALPPRNIRPRNLRRGVYRGGRRPIDIFWRIQNGIDGTPMPAANKQAVQANDIWDLVNYVLSIPYESVSLSRHVSEPINEREVH